MICKEFSYFHSKFCFLHFLFSYMMLLQLMQMPVLFPGCYTAADMTL